MADPGDIKGKLERAIKAVEKRPSIGQGTATTTTRLRPGGLACDVEDRGWTFVADEGPDLGGESQGPDPGVFTRAGLGSCLAIGYAMWAALLDIPLESVEVTVEADYDARGMFGLDDGEPAGWGAVRYTTRIQSPAPEERVRELVEHADRYSSVLDIIRRAIPVSGELRIGAGERA